MRLSWNEIRVRAKSFSDDWKDAAYEKGETQSFYNDFFKVFGILRRSVGSYEQAVKKLSGGQGFVDLFWPGMLLVEQKSAGKNLGKAEFQAMEYVHALKDSEKPRYVLVSDFQSFKLIDLSEREELKFTLNDLHKHVEKFRFIIGVERRQFKDQDPVNIKAAELVGKLHDALEESGFEGRDLEVFLVQIVFCLFADDTGVFQPKDMLLRFFEDRTKEDGSDLGPLLSQIFQTLDTKEKKRSKNLDEDLDAFPYINGRLFERRTRIPSFDAKMREALIDASRFDWSPISPAIFGALFQSVMNKEERRKKGAHYTTEKNILKVIGPLFMDELRAEFERANALKRGRRNALDQLLDKLSTLTFFDPACGCGNFLIIAYRELRLLEIDILKARMDKTALGQLELDAALLSNIDVDQFYGIELEEFPARIAETAMWMMDHIMNNELSLAFGQNYARIPLEKAANIAHGDALEIDWENVLPAENCSYVFGNPPFIGKKEQSKKQKEQLRNIFFGFPNAGEMDYVLCWFKKTAEYFSTASSTNFAFVATNSITQGEQAERFWLTIPKFHNLEIQFAHRTFEWRSEGRFPAHVHVVIIGIRSPNEKKEKIIYDYESLRSDPIAIVAKNINAYLIDYRDIIVSKNSSSPEDIPNITKGSEATDWGFLVLDSEEKNSLLQGGVPRNWIRPYWGGKEYINHLFRYCLWLTDASPNELRKHPLILSKTSQIKEKRLKSSKPRTREWAAYPHLFSENRQPQNEYILVPKVSSENREYIPIGFCEPSIIVSGSAQFVNTSERWVFSLITSTIHMAWMRTVGGRTKSDYQYTNTLVYNTFPWPTFNDKSKELLAQTGQAILDARANWPESTLADLYDPNTMPANLRKAHQANDRAVDRLYRKRPFESERERVEHLFMLYEQLQAPLVAAAKPKPRRRKPKTIKTS